MLTFGVIRLVN